MDALKQTMRLKAELDELRPLSKADELRIMQKFRLDWNYHSNNLEGNSLTFGETKALILHGITAQGKPLKDHFEITGHNEAIEMVIEIVKEERPLSETFIRELHELLLKEPYQVDAITPEGKPTKKWVKVGEYKTSDNHVETSTGEIFRFATHQETPAKMEELIVWYRKKTDSDEVNHVLLAAEFHYRFIRIHPFDDGNGRTARILMNFILMQGGYPPVVIKTEDKENYFAALQQADAGIFDAFLAYIVANLNWSLEIMLSGARGENIEEEDDLEKEIALLEGRLSEHNLYQQKTVEGIATLFSVSVSRIITVFEEKVKLMDRFYSQTDNSHIIIANDGESHEMVYKKLVKNSIFPEYLRIKGISLLAISSAELRHFNFNPIHHPASDLQFKSIIRIIFQEFEFEVKNDSGISFTKNYGQQLSDEEIKQLVNSEVKRHKDWFSTQMKEKGLLD